VPSELALAGIDLYKKKGMRMRTFTSGIMVLFTYLLIIVFLIMITEADAQQLHKQKAFKMKITTKDGSFKRGYLLSMQDSTVYLNENPDDAEPFEVKFDQIKTIRIRRKHSIRRGIGIGMGTGALVGFIIGYASYEKPDCSGGSLCFDFGPEYDGFAGMALGGLIGGAIGGIAGAASKKIEINGDQNSFELIKPELAKYQIQFNPLAEVNK
jgi:hypothetical protein